MLKTYPTIGFFKKLRLEADISIFFSAVQTKKL